MQRPRSTLDDHVCGLDPFGAEVAGVQIADVDNDLAGSVAGLIARHRVLVFRDQDADDTAFVAFLKRLGPLMFTDGEIPVDHAPDLNVVSNIGRTVPPRSVFHTDTSYVERPPAFSALRAVMLPEIGGETLFSDQVRAAASLPGPVRDRLSHCTVMHEATDPAGTAHAVRHPLIRRHPLTGKEALYLTTPKRCGALSGVDDATSQRIVALLYRRSIRPAHLYRHRWQPRDIVIWDNRVTMHRAEHGNVAGDRVLHRGMVEGERPMAVA